MEQSSLPPVSDPPFLSQHLTSHPCRHRPAHILHDITPAPPRCTTVAATLHASAHTPNTHPLVPVPHAADEALDGLLRSLLDCLGPNVTEGTHHGETKRTLSFPLSSLSSTARLDTAVCGASRSVSCFCFAISLPYRQSTPHNNPLFLHHYHRRRFLDRFSPPAPSLAPPPLRPPTPIRRLHASPAPAPHSAPAAEQCRKETPPNIRSLGRGPGPATNPPSHHHTIARLALTAYPRPP